MRTSHHSPTAILAPLAVLPTYIIFYIHSFQIPVPFSLFHFLVHDISCIHHYPPLPTNPIPIHANNLIPPPPLLRPQGTDRREARLKCRLLWICRFVQLINFYKFVICTIQMTQFIQKLPRFVQIPCCIS